MSYPLTTAFPSEQELLMEDISKAFKEVTRICRLFLDKPTKSTFTPTAPVIKSSQNAQHINFNNYKGSQQQKNHIFQTIASFNVDGDSSEEISAPTPKKPQVKPKEPSSIIKPQIKPQIKPSSPVSNIPPPPKAPLSPYFIFYKQKKDVIKDQFSEMSVTEITTAAGKVWKSLTEEEKEPFNKKFFEEKEKYDREMKAYVKKYPNYKEMSKKMPNVPSNTNQKN